MKIASISFPFFLWYDLFRVDRAYIKNDVLIRRVSSNICQIKRATYFSTFVCLTRTVKVSYYRQQTVEFIEIDRVSGVEICTLVRLD